MKKKAEMAACGGRVVDLVNEDGRLEMQTLAGLFYLPGKPRNSGLT